MIKDYNELTNEKRMLEGNVNRMIVTSDNEELNEMYEFAKRRLEEIHNFSLTRLANRELK